MNKLLLGGIAATFAISPAVAATNLVTNGGFEQTTAGVPSFEVGPNYIYGQAVTGWTSTAGSNTNSNSAYNLLFDSKTATTADAKTRYPSEPQRIASENYGGASPNGGNFMALDGDINFNGYFYQQISGLTPGAKYTLNFIWAGTQLSNRTGATTEKLDVIFGNAFNGPAVYTTNTVGGPTHYFSGWQSVSTTVTATGATQFLSFLSRGTPTGLPPVALLDGVSLQAVPEPATWGMLLLGFGTLGAALRRKRARSVVYA